MADEGSEVESNLRLVYEEDEIEEKKVLLVLEPPVEVSDLGYPDLDLGIDIVKSEPQPEASTSNSTASSALPVPLVYPQFDNIVGIKEETEGDDSDYQIDTKLEPWPQSSCKSTDSEQNFERPSIADIVASDEKLRRTPVIRLRDIRVPLLVPLRDNCAPLLVPLDPQPEPEPEPEPVKPKRKRILYPCVHCERFFYTKGYLRKHINVCGAYKAKRKLAKPVLNNEVDRHINGQNKKEKVTKDLRRRKSKILLEDKKAVICQHCGEYFTSKEELLSHLYCITLSKLLCNTTKNCNFQSRRKNRIKGNSELSPLFSIKEQSNKTTKRNVIKLSKAGKASTNVITGKDIPAKKFVSYNVKELSVVIDKRSTIDFSSSSTQIVEMHNNKANSARELTLDKTSFKITNNKGISTKEFVSRKVKDLPTIKLLNGNTDSVEIEDETVNTSKDFVADKAAKQPVIVLTRAMIKKDKAKDLVKKSTKGIAERPVTLTGLTKRKSARLVVKTKPICLDKLEVVKKKEVKNQQKPQIKQKLDNICVKNLKRPLDQNKSIKQPSEKINKCSRGQRKT